MLKSHGSLLLPFPQASANGILKGGGPKGKRGKGKEKKKE